MPASTLRFLVIRPCLTISLAIAWNGSAFDISGVCYLPQVSATIWTLKNLAHWTRISNTPAACGFDCMVCSVHGAGQTTFPLSALRRFWNAFTRRLLHIQLAIRWYHYLGSRDLRPPTWLRMYPWVCFNTSGVVLRTTFLFALR
ncbi:uncharacterized protein M421DRAFT_169268 [Didymella exigua CBS 183.55]|uniref:Secreted protein n=1 Tax=Didymella exigua CBS 183.55 TaxID=1150837 RepID=A0A6A5RJA4_9PLEO|nr:uncharacterized protein M421DRAFT_169268 [Didymella exigua CBS 183.55]KAF1927513.1 hypothetical protein M421DRAFT_169268 [Didymella exigua CBS 183.55]